MIFWKFTLRWQKIEKYGTLANEEKCFQSSDYHSGSPGVDSEHALLWIRAIVCTGVDRGAGLSNQEESDTIRQPANRSFVHTNPHCWSEHIKCAVPRTASIRNRVMNRISFVGSIAFCPEFARRNGSTAWMLYARVHIYVHPIYIGHMPIGKTRQNSVHFINLPSTHFTSCRYSWLHDKKVSRGREVSYC